MAKNTDIVMRKYRNTRAEGHGRDRAIELTAAALGLARPKVKEIVDELESPLELVDPKCPDAVPEEWTKKWRRNSGS